MKQQSVIRSVALTTTNLFPLDGIVKANADPITAAIAAAIGSTAVAQMIVNTLAAFALSALSAALTPKPKFASGGIQTDATTAGETEPQKFILGYYATNGGTLAPPYTHSSSQKKQNRYLTYITSVSDLPINDIVGFIVDDEEVTLLPDEGNEFGRTVEGRLENMCWFRWHDGNQTTADSYLQNVYSIHETRPWTSNHKLKGVAYAVATFDYYREEYSGLPSVRYIVKGVPLYDPRKDTSVGGSGSHRYGTPSTYSFTTNPIVMIYNLVRGIQTPDGSIYGIGAKASALPLARWFAAMNVADENGTQSSSTDWRDDQKRYRAGLEVSLDTPPLDVIDELLKTCGGLMAEHGGLYNISVGSPALPVAHITDDQIIISDERAENPFQGLAETINTVRGTYPDLRNLWESAEANPFTKPAWIAEDGDLELVADVKLSAVPWPRQVRRILREMANDHRRRRVHTITLPPAYLGLVPLDTITWTSPDKFYSAKAFEVQQCLVDPLTLNIQVSLRERDPNDYDLDAVADAIIPAYGNRNTVVPVIEVIDGFAVAPGAMKDSAGKNRIPTIDILWDGDNNYTSLLYQIRLQSEPANVINGSTSNTSSGKVTVSENILPAEVYEVRARVKEPKIKSVWTAWLQVTTFDIRQGIDNLAQEVLDLWDESLEEAERLANAMGIQAYSTLPASGLRVNQIILKLPDLVLMRWDGSNWVNTLYAGVRAGYLDATKFAQSIKPVEVVATLPTSNNTIGRMVLLTTDKKLYRYDGTAFTKAVDGADVVANSITAGSIAVGAIGADQIAANSLTSKHISIGDFTNHASGSDFEDAALVPWALGSNMARTASTARSGSYSLQLNPGADVAPLMTPIDVTAGDQFYVCLWARRNTAFNGLADNSKLRFGDFNTGALIAALSYGVPNITTANVWQKIELNFTVPSGCTRLNARLGVDSTAGQVFLDDIEIRRKSAGNLIVDGTITADHIKFGTITGDNIAANTIFGSQIVAGSITANSAVIANGAIISAKIANAAIQTLHVANSAIKEAQIANAAITTAKIGNLQVDTLQIAGNAVTALRKISHGGSTDTSANWTNCGAITFTPEINGDLVVWCSTEVAAGIGTLTSGSLQVMLRYLWRGSVVNEFTPLRLSVNSSGAADGPTRIRFADITAFSAGSGSGTFQVQVRRNGGGSSSSGATTDVVCVIGEFKK